MKNHHGGVVLVNGYLYGFNDSILTCLEFATGKQMWRDRSVGKGSVTYADGNLYIQGENNVVGLAEASPDGISGKRGASDRRQGTPELGPSGRQRRPALRAQPGLADGVRHQGEVADPVAFLSVVRESPTQQLSFLLVSWRNNDSAQTTRRGCPPNNDVRRV